MRRVTIRRSTPKSHKGRRTLFAVGALGVAAEGVRRWRHRHGEHDRPEQIEH
jgi:hypothetical protein